MPSSAGARRGRRPPAAARSSTRRFATVPTATPSPTRSRDAAPLLFVECRAPARVLAERAARRDRQPARVSDASLSIVVRESRAWEPLDELAPEAHVTLRSDRPVEAQLADLVARTDRRSLFGRRAEEDAAVARRMAGTTRIRASPGASRVRRGVLAEPQAAPIVSGKAGVGKSMVAAALGVAAVRGGADGGRRGRRPWRMSRVLLGPRPERAFARSRSFRYAPRSSAQPRARGVFAPRGAGAVAGGVLARSRVF